MEAHSNNIRTPENDSRINVCELSQRRARRAAVGSSFVSLAKRRVSVPIARSLRGGAHYSIENPLYRYLIAISKLRLGILTEPQGESSEELFPFFRSSLINLNLFIYLFIY